MPHLPLPLYGWMFAGRHKLDPYVARVYGVATCETCLARIVAGRSGLLSPARIANLAIFDSGKGNAQGRHHSRQENIAGQLYRLRASTTGPPNWIGHPRLISALLDADRLVGRLAGEASRLPHPHILIRPFLQREAVLSSKSEGTQATLGELLAAEAGALVDHSPEDLREVATTCFAANCMGIRRD